MNIYCGLDFGIVILKNIQEHFAHGEKKDIFCT